MCCVLVPTRSVSKQTLGPSSFIHYLQRCHYRHSDDAKECVCTRRALGRRMPWPGEEHPPRVLPQCSTLQHHWWPNRRSCSGVHQFTTPFSSTCLRWHAPHVRWPAWVGKIHTPNPNSSTPPVELAPGVYSPPPRSPPPPSNVPQRANQLLSLLNTARAATRDGDYDAALAAYTQGVRQFPDLALSEYARLGRALLLYQVGLS